MFQVLSPWHLLTATAREDRVGHTRAYWGGGILALQLLKIREVNEHSR